MWKSTNFSTTQIFTWNPNLKPLLASRYLQYNILYAWLYQNDHFPTPLNAWNWFHVKSFQRKIFEFLHCIEMKLRNVFSSFNLVIPKKTADVLKKKISSCGRVFSKISLKERQGRQETLLYSRKDEKEQFWAIFFISLHTVEKRKNSHHFWNTFREINNTEIV